MKKLFFLPIFILSLSFVAFSSETKVESTVTISEKEEGSCTATCGEFSSTAPTCDEAVRGLEAMMGIELR